MRTEAGQMEQFKFDILTQMDKSRVSDIFKPLEGMSTEMLGNSPAPPPAAPVANPLAVAVGNELEAAAAALAVGAPAVVGAGVTATRATPTTPLTTSQSLMKAVHKLICEIGSVLHRMKAMKYQNELMVRFASIVSDLQEVYNSVSELVKNAVDTEPPYKPFLDQFLEIKASSLPDRMEGEGVVAHIGRPQKRTAKAGAKR